MNRSMWALLPVFSLFVPLLGQAQDNEESDPLLRVIELTAQVHFDDASGAPVVVPAGDYWVNAVDNTLTLAALDGASTFALKATAGTHDNELDDVTALVYDAGAELPDAVFVALMSPDGQEVVAQGSLSGVQQRGVLSDAKKKAAAAAAAAAAARKRAIENARRVAAEKARKARAVAQQAAAATAEVAQTVGETAQTVKENVQEAIPGTPFKDLVDAASTLGVQNLLSCLANARNDRQGNIAQLAKDFTQDPSAAIESLQSEVEQTVNARIGDFTKALDAIGDDPSPAQVTDAAFNLLKSIGKDRPAVGCLLAVIEPKMPELKRNIVRRQQAVIAAIDNTVNDKILPTILGGIEDKVKAVALGNDEAGLVQSRGQVGKVAAIGAGMIALRKWERQGMASGLYMESMEENFVAATSTINAELAKADPDPSVIRDAIASTTDWTDETALRVGIGMVRYRGHRAIDNADGFIKKKVEGNERIEAFGRRVAIKVVTSVCGLVPEAGAAICNAVFVPVEAISIWVVRKKVQSLIEGLLHKGWGLGVDGLEKLLLHGAESSAQDSGPFYSALRLLNKDDIAAAAERDLPPGFKEALTNYNDAVDRVIDQWEKDRH